MNELALFAGAGGSIMGGILLGWRTVCAVEIDANRRNMLLARQRDGVLPRFAIWNDVRTFDGRPWKGRVNVISAGFPCQDISSAGAGAGIDGKRSGLWREVVRIAAEVRPEFIFVENSPLLVGRGLARVLGDVASLGMDARWGTLGAADVGAPHLRKRLWLVAYSDPHRLEWQDVSLQPRRQKKGGSVTSRYGEAAAHSLGERLEGAIHMGDGYATHGHGPWRSPPRGTESRGWKGDHPEPGILGMDDGLADWKHRIAAAGDGQVPAVAATAWRTLVNIDAFRGVAR